MSALLLLALGAPAQAATIYVDDTVASSVQDGTSWATAYASLGTATAAATTGDSIQVAAGSYSGTHFIYSDNVTITGADPAASLLTGSIIVYGATAVVRDMGFPSGGGKVQVYGSVWVDNCAFSGAGTVGVEGEAGSSLSVTNSHIQDRGTGIDSVSFKGLGSNLFVQHTTFVDLSTGVRTSAANANIRMNYFDSVNYGVFMQGFGTETVVARHNSINAVVVGMYVASTGPTITSNMVRAPEALVLRDSDGDIAHNTLLGDVSCEPIVWSDTSYFVNNAVAGDFFGDTLCDTEIHNNVFDGRLSGSYVDLGDNLERTALRLLASGKPRWNSPLVGAAATSTGVSNLNRDFYNVKRDSTPEIGAVERP
jgi:hypothetical protein